jgi:hypothetical protein
MSHKIIIWGHKLHSHTHSYIHNSYFKAFKSLGYEVFWFDQTDDISQFDFSNSIFFTEDQVKWGMPLRNDCKYIAHHIQSSFFNGIDSVLNLGNYIVDVEKFDKVKDQTYFDSKTKTLYQCWATDLLPDEINSDDFCVYDQSKQYVNYVGSLYEEGLEFAQEFGSILKDNQKELRLYHGVSDEENQQLIRDSFLCPDFRNYHHIKVGYIPCRIFKTISYGQIIGTNSINVKRVFGDYVVFGSNPNDLYENMIEAILNQTIDMKEAMLFVKNNHTYINRVKTILEVL